MPNPFRRAIHPASSPGKGLFKNHFAMNIFERLKEYLRSSRTELQTVAWPSREETLRYTALVAGASLVFGLFFGLFDFGLSRLVESTVTRRTSPSSSEAQEPSPFDPNDVQVETASGTSGDISVTPVTGTGTQP